MQQGKKVLAVHDLSGVGRSSLTVIIPTLAAMKVQVYALPTAILSSHTGINGNIASVDLTDYMIKALAHYKQLGVEVDAVYTGYLSSSKQVEICEEAFRMFPNATFFVDPVLGDTGKAYSKIDKSLQDEMGVLAAASDVLTPNLTEACILLDREYPQRKLKLTEYIEILRELAQLGGAKQVVLTGAAFEEGELVNLLYNRESGEFYSSTSMKVSESYPGTGDIFSSVYLGSILQGNPPCVALEQATRFMEYSITKTYELGSPREMGIQLESCLHWFCEEKPVQKSSIILREDKTNEFRR